MASIRTRMSSSTTTSPFPARVGSWLAGQNQFGIFTEPDPSQLELDGKAFPMASIGETVGFADYTSFMATDKYIKDNPEVIQNFTNAIAKAMKWTASASPAEIVAAIEPFFPGVNKQALTNAVSRYQTAEDVEDDARDRGEADRRSSRTSWCTAMCWSRASA